MYCNGAGKSSTMNLNFPTEVSQKLSISSPESVSNVSSSPVTWGFVTCAVAVAKINKFSKLNDLIT